MKKIMLFVFCLASFIAQAQPSDMGYSIKGKIGSYHTPARIYLQYEKDNQVETFSSGLNNGEFSFSGTIDFPASGWLIIAPEGVQKAPNEIDANDDLLSFMLANENIEINSSDSLKNAKITGSPVNQDLERLAKETIASTKLSELMTEFEQASPEQKKNENFIAEIQSRYKTIYQEIESQQIGFIKNNPNSLVSLILIRNLSQQNDDIQPLLQSLSPELQSNPVAQSLNAMFEAKKQTAVGAIAPDFIQNDPEGNPIKLSDFRGKYVLIDFWASWCRPCRQENPHLVKAYSQFKDKNFEILGVSLDNPNGKTAWLNAIEQDNLTWPQVSDLQGIRNSAAQLYSVFSIPQNFLLDPEGKIIAKGLRGAELLNVLQEKLGTDTH